MHYSQNGTFASIPSVLLRRCREIHGTAHEIKLAWPPGWFAQALSGDGIRLIQRTFGLHEFSASWWEKHCRLWHK
jgi:hypothetical protein